MRMNDKKKRDFLGEDVEDFMGDEYIHERRGGHGRSL
jgi:hypothetical protein